MALVFDAAALGFGSTRGFRQLLTVTVGAGIVAMVTGLLHDALGAKGLFGSYVFPAASHFIPLAAPFSNPNVAGSLAMIAALAAWVLATIGTEGTLRRTVWLTVGAVLSLHAFRLAAYGALAAMGAALASAVIAGLVVRRLRGNAATVALATLPVMVSICCAICLYLSSNVALTSANTASISSKFEFWKHAYRHLGEAGIFGFGPGSFHDLGARFLPMAGGYRPAFAESEPAQIIFDHGWVPSVVCIVVGYLLFLSLVRRCSEVSQPGYAAVIAVFAVFVVCDTHLGMSWESLPFSLLVLALASASLRMVAPLQDVGTPRSAGPLWLVGGTAFAVMLAAAPGLESSMRLGQERGRNPFVGLDRKRADADGTWKTRVVNEARLSPVAPIVLVEDGRRSLAKGDSARATQIAGWLRDAAPMDDASLAFRINEAEARGSTEDVCARTRDYLAANNPYLVRPRFWRRLQRDVSKWVSCLPVDSSAEQAALTWLRSESRLEDALALTLSLMSRSPRHVPTLDAGFSLAFVLRRYDSAEIFLQQRLAAAGESAATERMRLSLRAASGVTRAHLDDVGRAIGRYPADPELRRMRLMHLAELGRRGEAPAGARELIEDDAHEIRLGNTGSPSGLANCALLIAQTLIAIGEIEEAEQQLKLAAEWAPLRQQVERSLAAMQSERVRAPNPKLPRPATPPK